MAVAVKNAPVAAGSSPFDRMSVMSLVGAVYILASLAVALWAVPALWNMAGVTAAWQSVFDYWGQGSPLIICMLMLGAAAGIGFVAYRVQLAQAAVKGDVPHDYAPRALFLLAGLVGLAGLLQIAGGAVLLLGAELFVVVALAYLGYRLLGSNPPVGARAGVFVGLAAFILVLVLSRWVSLWLEHWIFAYHMLGDSPTVGMVISSVVGLALVGGVIYLFLRPEAEKYLVLLEGQGWFSATAYKGLQGQRVRRGTILGILLIAGSGVWTMWNNGLLHRLPQNWALNIPFTATVLVEDPGDAVPVLKGLPAQAKEQVKIVSAGGSALKPGSMVSQAVYRDALKSRIQESPDLSDAAKDRLKTKVDEKDIGEILNASASPAFDTPANLPAAELVDQNTLRDAKDQVKIVSAGGSAALKRESLVTQAAYRDALKSRIQESADLSDAAKDRLKKEVAEKDIGEILNMSDSPAFKAPAGLPAVALPVDQYTLRDVNDRLKRDYVRVADLSPTSPQLTNLKTGSVVTREELDKAANDPNLKSVGGQPIAAPVFAATGPIQYRSLTLLPSVQLLLPMLLLLGSMWLAWRVVNYPPFADFLIATEAELNKVSWTTRPRLIQDTIVVLVTVFLMAMFLFLMDQTWRIVLSSWPIKVLQISDDQSDKNKSAEQKPW